jgi:glycine/D-amino acid oxidase-like deaminating enzyme
VAVIERESAGFGASGRNAGHLTPTIGKDLPSLLRVFGRQRARRLVALAERAIGHVEELIERHEIECAYHPGGNVIAAIHECQHARLERAARAASELGAQAVWLAPEDMRKRGLPECFSAGVLEGRGGVLDPARYVWGLRRAVLEAGAELYEHTPLLRIEEAPRVVLHTPRGLLVADRVVLATNAYTPESGRLRSVVLPMIVSLFRTAPLAEEQRAALGWPGREGIYTAHEALESYHLTADRRIVGGARFVRYGFGARRAPEHHPPTFAALERLFRERFPGLDVAIEEFWSGPIAFTLDFLPALGCTGRFRNLFYAIGYAGHGIPLASFAGRMLADWIAGREGPGRELIERRRPPLPPEPLRWLVARGLVGLFDWLDGRVDRRVRSL